MTNLDPIEQMLSRHRPADAPQRLLNKIDMAFLERQSSRRRLAMRISSEVVDFVAGFLIRAAATAVTVIALLLFASGGV